MVIEMDKNIQKPSIRFKGFTDTWEQCKFNDLAETKRGLTYKPADVSTNGIRVLRSSNINEDYFEQKEDDVFVTQNAINIDYVKSKDILITSANGSSRLVGKHAIITNIADNSAVHGGFMLLARTDYPYFLNASMSSRWYEKFINLYVAGGNGAIGNLSKSNLDDYDILAPSDSEKLKVGELFKSIDSLITLHQRKYDKLVNIKKALLDKMFPKAGEVTPKLRFRGFTDTWEQREAKDLVSITTGKSNTQDQSEDGIYPFYIRSEVPVKSDKFLFEEEAVITIGDGQIGEVFHYVNGKFDLHQRCYKMADFNEITGKYFYYYFSTMFYDRAMKMTAKATVDSVRLEMISDMKIMFPKSIDEQTKISSLFTSLDNLITLHQHKYEKLKNIKKALLQKMFV